MPFVIYGKELIEEAHFFFDTRALPYLTTAGFKDRTE